MSDDRIAARFKLESPLLQLQDRHRAPARCAGRRDAPTCVDELMESQFLAERRFACKACEMPIGIIVAAVQIHDYADA